MNNLHKQPYIGSNNKKKTRGRVAFFDNIQSIPCHDLVGNLLGYKYINHKDISPSKLK